MSLLESCTHLVDAICVASVVCLLLIGAGFLTLPVMHAVQQRRLRERDPGHEAVQADGDLPSVLLQLPVFNEPEMVAPLLACASALDWPRDRLEIQLLDDSTDGTSAIADDRIRALTAAGYRASHLQRPNRKGFKADALAAGLAASEAPFVAMLDADFRPPRNWLRSVVPPLMQDERAAFVQSRCEFSNAGHSALTRAQGMMQDTHFIMEQRVRARAGLLFQFNGTGGVWRRSALEEAGGWNGASLVEDLDLTFRAFLAGWHGLFVSDPPVPGQVPERLDHWQVQQQRWSMGFAQIARRLVVPVLHSRWPMLKKLSALFLICYQVFLPLAALASTMAVLDLALHGGHFTILQPFLYITPAMIAVVAVSMTLPPYLELERGSLWTYVRTMASLPPLVLYLALTNAGAVVGGFFGASSTFRRTPKRLSVGS